MEFFKCILLNNGCCLCKFCFVGEKKFILKLGFKIFDKIRNSFNYKELYFIFFLIWIFIVYLYLFLILYIIIYLK